MAEAIPADETEALLYTVLDAEIFCDAEACYEAPAFSHHCLHCDQIVWLCLLHTKAMDHHARQIVLMGHPICCAKCARSFTYPLTWVAL